MKTIDTYCCECDKKVAAEIRPAVDTLAVRGEDIEYSAELAFCPYCGQIIADSRVEDKNIKRLYEEYNKRHGWMTAQLIKETRQQYGLSLREFSKFLGFGEQTFARYEAGSLLTKKSNDVIKMALTATGAQILLDQNRNRLSEKSIKKVECFIAGLNGDSEHISSHKAQTELKDKAQLTIPKAIVKELNLKQGDLFDVAIQNGSVLLTRVAMS